MTRSNGWKAVVLALVLCGAATVYAGAQVFTTIVNFNGTNGGLPEYESLIQGRDGSLYGTTYGGGSNSYGTVFKLSPAGKLKSIYNFCAEPSCTDGSSPATGLILATNGKFYGTTEFGGDLSCPFYETCGTVFSLTPDGTLSSLYTFSGLDGELPIAPLVEAEDGNFYGATPQGGTGGGDGCCGTVFRITSQGTLTTLHSFSFDNDGQSPNNLIQGTNGLFYGTTAGISGGQGSVFSLTSGGAVTTLHIFGYGGATPRSGLILGTNGNFYGTTSYGTVYSITPQGVVTLLAGTLYGQPWAGVIQATDGNLYGTTAYGGDPSCNCGEVYSVTQSGLLTILHIFEGVDGSMPYGGLFQATNGKIYGTTFGGGSGGGGTVYSLDMGLPPFVMFVQAAGKVGQTGGILGQGFTGTTSVAINGIQARFAVVSDTYIKATVPQGATTGYVTVTTPTGVLTSNVPFHVIP